jgi:hypothetical protein
MKARDLIAATLIGLATIAVAAAQQLDVVGDLDAGTIVTLVDPAAAHPRTIPLWSSTFTYQGTTFPLITVGTDPTLGSATTIIPTVIIPLRVVFADGTVLDASANLPQSSYSALEATVNSPLFQPVQYTTGGVTVGLTQYADAMQRAQFWNAVSPGGPAPDYHVLLASPTVLDVQQIDVPANLGFTVLGTRSHTRIGFVDVSWFLARVENLAGKLHLDPRSLPIFLNHNTFFFYKQPSNGSILGFLYVGNDLNANGQQPIQTFMVSAYTDPGVFRAAAIRDVYLLSHQLTRWINDPFGINVVPSYFAPAWSPSCLTALHVSDPVFGKGFDVSLSDIDYHLSDTAFVSWFEQVVPSTAVNGYYSFANNLPALSPCP